MLSISQVAFLYTALSFFRYLLGFLSQVVITHQFGAEAFTDAYFLGLSIPQIITDLVGVCLLYGLMPISVALNEKKGKREEQTLYTQVLIGLIVFSFFLMAIYYAVVPWVVRCVAVGFDPSKMDVAVHVARRLSPLIILWTLAHFFSAILLAQKKYFHSTMAALLHPILLILFCYRLTNSLSDARLIYGTLFGAFAQACLSAFFCFQLKSFTRHFQPVKEEMKKFASLVFPNVLNVMICAAFPLQQKYFASQSGDGALSCLSYALALYNIPAFILFSSIQTVLYSRFTQDSAKSLGVGRQGDVLFRSLRLAIYLSIPISFFMIVLRKPIIALFFQRGAFGVSDTELTAFALAFLLLGFVFHALSEIFIRVMYSEQNPWLPMKAFLVGNGVGMLLNPLLYARLGIGGLALSYSAVVSLYFLILFLGNVKKRLEFPHGVFVYMGKVSAITAALAFGIDLLKNAFSWGDGFMSLLVQITALFVFASAIYFLSSFWWAASEASLLLNLFNLKKWVFLKQPLEPPIEGKP
jgi:putative peptidoglycan lipid II flippase